MVNWSLFNWAPTVPHNMINQLFVLLVSVCCVYDNAETRWAGWSWEQRPISRRQQRARLG